ncbi:MAG TPA: HEPN domain-containing protein [Sedimentisphaerales bacterium]|nr:HEPN domain-containing protein [Sedimentisphaerales bacterium]
MTASNRDLVAYRLQRAHESLEDACILADAKRWNPCVNRLYYACFYAVSALLTQEGLSSSRHTGVRSLFNQHFVRMGKVDKSSARIFNDLFERRQEGDYVDFVSFEESQIRAWMPQAEAFVDQIADLIKIPPR